MKPICDNNRIVSLFADKLEVMAWWLESRRRMRPLLTDSPLFRVAERQHSQIDVKAATQLGMIRIATSEDFPGTEFSTVVVSRT